METQGFSTDLVMRNGNVITVDARDTIAEAFAAPFFSVRNFLKVHCLQFKSAHLGDPSF